MDTDLHFYEMKEFCAQTVVVVAQQSCAPRSTSSATISDKPNMAKIERFDKSELKKTETQDRNPLPSKETIEQKQAGKS
ncbi:thymosin beta-4-like [Lontra canadensis]|uniref:thymosin beta-4-like n=1 Tax=Lontra canadensis TaxID=76717 RepID=UPI0013F3252A|nr:thymosin beta-4-like [Lontra canadensis]